MVLPEVSTSRALPSFGNLMFSTTWRCEIYAQRFKMGETKAFPRVDTHFKVYEVSLFVYLIYVVLCLFVYCMFAVLVFCIDDLFMISICTRTELQLSRGELGVVAGIGWIGRCQDGGAGIQRAHNA